MNINSGRVCLSETPISDNGFLSDHDEPSSEIWIQNLYYEAEDLGSKPEVIYESRSIPSSGRSSLAKASGYIRPG